MHARGIVINVHLNGATVRLDDGSLAAVPPTELAAHRPAYVASLQRRTPLEFALERSGRHRAVFLTAGGSNDRAVPVLVASPLAAPSEAGSPAEPKTTDATAAGASQPDDAAEDDLEDGEIVRTLRLVDGTPMLHDPLFEHRIAAYLKSTEAWAPADRPPPDERHESRKKKRAAFFDTRSTKRRPPG